MSTDTGCYVYGKLEQEHSSLCHCLPCLPRLGHAEMGRFLCRIELVCRRSAHIKRSHPVYLNAIQLSVRSRCLALIGRSSSKTYRKSHSHDTSSGHRGRRETSLRSNSLFGLWSYPPGSLCAACINRGCMDDTRELGPRLLDVDAFPPSRAQTAWYVTAIRTSTKADAPLLQITQIPVVSSHNSFVSLVVEILSHCLLFLAFKARLCPTFSLSCPLTSETCSAAAQTIKMTHLRPKDTPAPNLRIISTRNLQIPLRNLPPVPT